MEIKDDFEVGALPNEYNNPRKLVSTKKQVTLNGELLFFAAEATLLDIVHALDLQPDRLAIELNRAIVRRENWDSLVVDSGAEIEVVQFVGGG